MSWEELLASRLDRRSLIGAAAALAVPASLRASTRRRAASARLPFTPVPPSSADRFTVPKGFDAQVLLRWQDSIGNGAAFGNDPDFTAYFPIDLRERGCDAARPHMGFAPRSASSSDGLLVVNHEQFDPRFLHGPSWRDRTAAQIAREQGEVGVSVTRIARVNGKWTVAADARLNRRYDARTRFRLTGPAAAIDGGPEAVGTLANCSGGVTPWGTVLSCEENYQDYLSPGFGWSEEIYARRHYGWIVEIDPFDPAATPRKHTAMGRMRHENVAIRVAKDGTVAAYMGDDKRDSCVFKFVAERKLGRDRDANLGILEKGRLYAADFEHGRWLEIAQTAEALADARAAALAVKATPVDRPEDLEIDPIDGSVFIALTNNANHGNFHGHIVRLAEKDGDVASTEFEWSIFATGGPQSGFSSPDNLLFDDAGNLWMCTDVSDSAVGRGIYSFMANNSMFFFPRGGSGALYRFATGPIECELTGPAFTPDGSTLFLSVQHPGGDSAELETKGPSSHWPEGGAATPRGAVVAITGL